MAVAEVFSIICLLFTIILSSVVIKDCWEYLGITDSLSLRILLKISIFLIIIAIFLSLLLVLSSAFRYM